MNNTKTMNSDIIYKINNKVKEDYNINIFRD